MSHPNLPGLCQPWSTVARTPLPSVAELRRLAANDSAPAGAAGPDGSAGAAPDAGERRPTAAQRRWLRRGLDQAGGKLPLFDGRGQKVSRRMVEACIAAGWAEPWFDNPLKPEWLVCRLTEAGRGVAAGR